MRTLEPFPSGLTSKEVGPLHVACRNEISSRLEKVLETMDSTARSLVEGRNGFGRPEASFKKLALEIGCSLATARRLYQKTIKKIDRELRRMGIDDCE